MTMRPSLFRILACVASAIISADVAARVHVISSEAAAFVKAGAETSLRGCDLPHNKCGMLRFIVIDRGSGESNDEKRTWRKMRVDGLEVSAIFPVAAPSGFYLEELRISSSRWPVLNGLVIGAPRRLVAEKIDPPSDVNENGCDIYFSDALQGDATFCFTRGKIRTIMWHWFID